MKKPPKKGGNNLAVYAGSPLDELAVRARFYWALALAELRGAAEELLEQVKLLWQMLTDPGYVLRWETKAAVVAALTYFVSPVDAIPDPIPGVGYLDDAVLVAWLFHQLGSEVTRYRELLAKRKNRV